MQWSKYQLAVFDFVINQPGNVFVNAVAGSGKTTVIEECINQVDPDQSVLAVAFNRHIRDELKKRLSCLPNVTVHTLNSFGNSVYRKNVRRYTTLKEDKTEKTLFFDVFGTPTGTAKSLYYKIRFSVCKMVSLCKANMFWEPTNEQLAGLMLDYSINQPKDVEFGQLFDYVRTTLDACMKKTLIFDWDDQVAFPIYYDWDIPTFDRVFVDEAQDLSPIQIELTRRTIGEKAIYVGDPCQAIYQFRGADSQAIKKIIETLSCTELPLSICYRCSKAVVRRAQQKVPHIEYSENAPEGLDLDIKKEDFDKMVMDGDVILCRCTAPLITECLKLIGKGRKAVVKGRDFGEDLLALLPEEDQAVELFAVTLEQWYNDNTESMRRQNRDSIVIQDKYDSLRALFGLCKTTGEIRKLINSIFTKDCEGITFMTGHKSKGLEAKRIFILKPDLLPHPKATNLEAENNLWYVMVTRAKLDLYWIAP